MADVFLSYARQDEAAARLLAERLTAEGWNVWWDRQILPGRDFSNSIQRELEGAVCVVVLWSKASIISEYVRDEAGEAIERNVLVPARIDDVKVPLGFRQRQAADLKEWQGNIEDQGYVSLVNAIDLFVPRAARARQKAVGNVSTEVRPSSPEPAERREEVRPAQTRSGWTAVLAHGLSRRQLLAAGAAVLAIVGWQFGQRWSDPPRRTFRELPLEIRLGNTMTVQAVYGTADFYRALDPKVVVGGLFAPEEMWSRPRYSPNAVLLNENFWRRRLNADMSVVGRSLVFNRYYFRVRGVVALPRRWSSVDILFPHKPDLAPAF